MVFTNERNYRVREVCKVNGETRWPIVETETQEIDGKRVGTLSEAFFGAAKTWCGAYADSEALRSDDIVMEGESLKNLYESVHNTGHGSMHLEWRAARWTSLNPNDIHGFKMEVDYTIDVID